MTKKKETKSLQVIGDSEEKKYVQYNNDFNQVSLAKFFPNEVNLLLSICVKAKHQQTNVISLTFKELKDLAGLPSRSDERVEGYLLSLYSKLLRTLFKEGENGVYRYFTIFNDFEIDNNEKKVKVSVNKNFLYLLNNMEKGQFTVFVLNDVISIPSTRGKQLFMLLKQFRTTGYVYMKKEQLHRLLQVPKSYDTSRMIDRIVKPAVKENEMYFNNLRMVRLKEGRRIVAFEFHFDKEKREETRGISLNSLRQKMQEKPIYSARTKNVTSQLMGLEVEHNDSSLKEFKDFVEEASYMEDLLILKICKEYRNKNLAYITSVLKTYSKDGIHSLQDFAEKEGFDKLSNIEKAQYVLRVGKNKKKHH